MTLISLLSPIIPVTLSAQLSHSSYLEALTVNII